MWSEVWNIHESQKSYTRLIVVTWSSIAPIYYSLDSHSLSSLVGFTIVLTDRLYTLSFFLCRLLYSASSWATIEPGSGLIDKVVTSYVRLSVCPSVRQLYERHRLASIMMRPHAYVAMKVMECNVRQWIPQLAISAHTISIQMVDVFCDWRCGRCDRHAKWMK